MGFEQPRSYELIIHQYVKKYPFRDAKKCENHLAKDGKIIWGIKYPLDEFVKEKDITSE